LCPHDYSQPGPACPRHLARSVDGGRTWHLVGPGQAGGGYSGVVALGGDDYLATYISFGSTKALRLYRSHDTGRTWQAAGVLTGHGKGSVASTDLASLFVAPWDTTRVFAGFGAEYLRPIVYRSTTGGSDWALVWQNPKSMLADRDNGDGPVVAFAGLTKGRVLLLADMAHVYRSTDGGTTWTRAQAGLPRLASEQYIWDVRAAPDGATAYTATGAGVYRSTDGGRSWQATAPSVPSE
jgi:photosystem II stability/assembly factor-like uncharacterized protein